MTHTPGPWATNEIPGTAGPRRFANEVWTEGATAFICSTEYDCMARHSPPPEVGDANCRLISAAPDLLEACQAAIEATGGSKFWNGETERFLKLCEAAIEKATGREAVR